MATLTREPVVPTERPNLEAWMHEFNVGVLAPTYEIQAAKKAGMLQYMQGQVNDTRLALEDEYSNKIKRNK